MRKKIEINKIKNLFAAIAVVLLLTCFLPMRVFADTNGFAGRPLAARMGDVSGLIKTAQSNGSSFSSKYTVIYHPNGGVGKTVEVTVDANADYTVKDQEYTRHYFLFDGWCSAPDGTGVRYENGQVIKVTSDIIIYALWSPKI
jgi:hypothetical protein